MHTMSILFNELGEKIADSSQRASRVLSIDDLTFTHKDNNKAMSFATLKSLLIKQSRIDVSIVFQDTPYVGDITRMEQTDQNAPLFVVTLKYMNVATRERPEVNTIFATNNIASWEWHVPSGVLQINERWANIQGFTLDEILPVTIKNWQDSLHPDYLDAFNNELQCHFSSQSDQFEIDYPIYNKYKELVWVKDFGKVVKRDCEGQPERVLVTRLDMTQIKAAQFKLIELQLQLDNLMALSPSLIYKMSADDDEHIQFITQNTEQLLGYDVDDILLQPKWWRRHIVPQDLWEYNRCRNIAKTRLEQPVMDCEYRFINKDGSQIWLIDRVRYVDNGYEPPYFIGAILDLSEFVTLNQHFKTLSLLPPGVIYQFRQDKDGHLSFPYASDEFENMFGVSAEDAAKDASIPFAVIHPDDLKKVFFEIENSQRTMDEATAEFRIVRDDVTRWYFFQSKPAQQQDGGFLWSGQIIDITERKSLEQQLAKQAITDDLTGAYNRRYFMEQAHRMLLRCQHQSQPFALLCIDLDHFKSVNDIHGHLCGDQVLIAAVKTMKIALRADDILARIGGEEFIIALPNVSLDSAFKVAERIRRDIKMGDVCCNDALINQTVTIGVVSGELNNELTELMKRGDDALYQGKQSGRDQIVIA